jgi:fructokinase
MTINGQEPTASRGILVVGETVIDLVEKDGVVTEHVGGSPANVALTLARLGNPVHFVTDLGADAHGDRARQHLAASAVAVESRSLARTSTAHARLQADGSAQYGFDISFSSQAVALNSATHVHTGSIAAFMSPSAHVVGQLLQSLPSGVTTSFDPNIRPALIGGPAAARETFESLAQTIDILKLSDEDAHWLYPGESLDALLNRFLGLGAALAVVTRGSEGMILASPVARVCVPAPTITVADTIGAGDSAMGAIIDAALRDGLTNLDDASLARIGSWATHIAAITTSRSGANPPWRDEGTAGNLSAGPAER